jgi:transposase
MQQVAVLDTGTGEVSERQLPHDGMAVEEFYAALPGLVTVGIESTGYAIWFHTLMQRLGHTLLVGDAAKIRAMVVRKTKTDRRDALHLLDLLRHDRFPTIWVPDPATRDLRALLTHRTHRMRLVRIRTMVKNGLHAIALNYRLARGSTLLRQAGLAQLHALALPPHTAQRRDQSLELLAGLTTQIRELDEAITTAALAHPDAPRLITHPGVGALTALATIVVLGPVARFPDSKHVVSYVGLAPSLNASADKYHLGHITKPGSPLLRFALGQAAAHAARMDADLKRTYFTLAHRRGRPKAKVAVARKLLVRLFIMLRDQIDDDEFPAARASDPRHRLGVRRSPTESLVPRHSFQCRTPRARAVSRACRTCGALPGLAGLWRTATRETLGTTSLRISSCFSARSGDIMDCPVRFPPGRARLVTSPLATGSMINAMTMGIVPVARFAAWAAGVPWSAAKPGSRS